MMASNAKLHVFICPLQFMDLSPETVWTTLTAVAKCHILAVFIYKVHGGDLAAGASRATDDQPYRIPPYRCSHRRCNLSSQHLNAARQLRLLLMKERAMSWFIQVSLHVFGWAPRPLHIEVVFKARGCMVGYTNARLSHGDLQLQWWIWPVTLAG